MLNISEVRIVEKVRPEKYSAFQILEKKNRRKRIIYVFATVLVISFLSLFLPWTQNIRAKGFVTSLRPSDRPQTIQAVIGGKIEKWYVNEGDHVFKGDTIIQISEVKEEYLDPQILERTQDQISAKQLAGTAYDGKAESLRDQLIALRQARDVKLEQNKIKLKQLDLYYQSDSLALEAAKVKLENSENQLARVEQLYNSGIKPLVDLENKRFEVQEAQAKLTEITNKLGAIINEQEITEANINSITNEYRDKIAKANSDLMSALSLKHNTTADLNKLQSQYNTYAQRQKNYYITSPVNGTINSALKSGIGEIIKNGEKLVNIVPDDYTLAVEMFIEPVDIPLLDVNQKVRILFDGWPAIVFSGWPNTSYGTFGGKVYMIENNINKNGKYRVLVAQDEDAEPWPRELRIGGGANTITLLNDVRVGYELWRQLNGFPPDYYKEIQSLDLKTKAPIRRLK